MSVVGTMTLGAACSRVKTPEAAEYREKWIESFNDSIDYYQNQMKITETQLQDCNNSVNSILSDFEHVSNPREVTGYYIVKGWRDKIPFTTTSIYARVNESEDMELIATLAGGVFNRVSVSDGTATLYSETVPNDQALNYRHDGYNTVCFSGAAADSIAQFINLNKGSRLVLSFINGNSSKEFVIPDNEKNMIARTSMLFDVKQRQKTLQKELWMDARKIDTFRRILAEKDSI